MATTTPARPYVWTTPLRWLLLLIAVVLLLLAAFGVKFASVDLVDLGLAFGFGSFLVPWTVAA